MGSFKRKTTPCTLVGLSSLRPGADHLVLPSLRLVDSVKYRTIVADPPWDVKRPTGWNSTRNHQRQSYPTMTVDEIAALNVAHFAADPSWLFVWTVNAYVEAAYDVARAWGFRPVTLLTWCKTPRGVGPGGMFATTTEFVLYGRRGAAPNGRDKAVDSSWFQWPRRGQSEKPEAFFDLVHEHFPGPYLELFARRQRLGWDTWGNEALGHVELLVQTEGQYHAEGLDERGIFGGRAYDPAAAQTEGKP